MAKWTIIWTAVVFMFKAVGNLVAALVLLILRAITIIALFLVGKGDKANTFLANKLESK